MGSKKRGGIEKRTGNAVHHGKGAKSVASYIPSLSAGVRQTYERSTEEVAIVATLELMDIAIS